MSKYHKINGLYKRYREGENKGKFIIGEYSKPEFELLKDIEWEWTEKIDGTNIRIYYFTHPLINIYEIKGRTDKAEVPEHLTRAIEKIIPKEKFEQVFEQGEDKPDIVLYGEGYGYKINGGGKYFESPIEAGFILFDIKIGNQYLKREDVEEIAKKLEIKTVPIVGHGTIDEAIKVVKSGMKSQFGDFIAEGLVIRPKYELGDRRRQRIITKIKYKDFK